MDVIYTPPWQEIDAVVSLAMQEDIDVIGVSSLATDHLIIPDLMQALGDAGLDDVRVFVGGIIPEQERPLLTDAGVCAIFGPGAKRDEIVECARKLSLQAQSNKRATMGLHS